MEMAFDGEGYVGTKTNHGLVIRTNDIQRIRLSTDGIVDFSACLVVRGTLPASPTSAAVMDFNQNRNRLLAFGNGSTIGSFAFVTDAGGGSTVATINGTTGAYTATSDINKKKDFEESTIGLNEILCLKPTLYRMKDEDNTSEKHLGFIAQEVKDFIPQAYIESDDFIGLNFNPIVATLTKAIQEQQSQIQELKAEIEILKQS
jgi:hypothetical protein